MHSGKIAVLVLALGVLGFFAWRRAGEVEDPAAASGEIELAPGLDPARVAAIRIESTARRQHVRLERDEQGVWWMVEPLAWRAEDAFVRELLDFGRRGTGRLAPGIAPADAGLVPPEHTLEFLERRLDGTERRHRIAFGAPDVDPSSVFALAGAPGEGVVVRTSRAPLSTIALPANELRSRRLLHFEWNEITALTRRGSLTREAAGPEVEPREHGELHLVAESQTDGWRVLEPVRARLDPHAMGLVLRNVAQLRIDHFYDDAPTELGTLGLDPALVRTELEIAGDELLRIDVGFPPHEDAGDFDEQRWLARVEGQDNVVGIGSQSVWLMVQPLERLIDHQIARFDRDWARGVSIEIDGRRVELERRSNAWWVLDGDQWRRAADGAVADLLGALARIELAGYPWLDEPDGAPQGVVITGRIEVRAQLPGEETPVTIGGELAAPTTAGGVGGRPLRRFDESAFGMLAEPDVAALVPPADALLSLRLIEVRELDQVSVSVAGEGRERRWTRDAQTGHWRADGAGVEDREFALVVDGLMFVRAERWLTDEEAALAAGGLEQRLAIAIADADGRATEYALGRLPGAGADGPVVAEAGDQRAVVGRGVHARLVEFLDAR